MAFRSRSIHPLPARHRWHPLARASWLLAACAVPAHAQAQSPPAGSPASQTVTVSGRNANAAASIAGFGDVPLSRAPFAATVLDVGLMQDAGIRSIADLTRLDAGITDAYNAPGYIGQLSVRGFTLDNRFNYRRDGLPINAETVIANGNKQAIEILKGTSGLQAGTSAPGGLVNLLVKRPKDEVGTATLSWTERNTLGMAVDVGRRANGFGWRVNADIEHLDPLTRSAQGQRRMLALAVEAQVASGSLIEAEVEYSRQSQPSTPGFSLLGNTLPDARSIDPRTNLNNQPWSLPVVMSGRTGSLRFTQDLNRDTQLVVQAMRQRLDSDDRIAFPYGCSVEGIYDRYCSNGSFDYYDFRSDGERRTSDALRAAVQGKAAWGGVAHSYSAGILATRYQARFNGQAFNLIAVPGTIDGKTVVPSAPDLVEANTNRDERSTEFFLQDAITLAPAWSLWTGLRHTRLHRESIRINTSDPRATTYDQSFTTPWLALSHAVSAQGQAYASWGQGVESEVAPNRSRYTNAGQALPALKSRQIELGYKHAGPTLDWRVAAFDIRRPAWRDIGACDSTADSCTRQTDGAARHRGIEAEADWRIGPLNLRGSAMLLKARHEDSADAGLNDQRPTNVPARSLKLQAAYNVAQMPGLALLAFVTHEGDRRVTPYDDITTPSWTRLDIGMRYTQRLAGKTVVWRAGIDNVTDHRAWQEAPYQFDHAYLYPLAPRTLHASATFGF
jgi:iron complex outermembrane receptor protein